MLYTDCNRQMAYELRIFEVVCKDCKRKAAETQKELEANGWELSWRGEVCPNCVAIDRQFDAVFA